MGVGQAQGVQVGSRRAHGWACWALGQQALGRWGAQGKRAHGALASARQAGRAAAGAGGKRQAQAGARGAVDWAASAHLGVLNWARLGFCAP